MQTPKVIARVEKTKDLIPLREAGSILGRTMHDVSSVHDLRTVLVALGRIELAGTKGFNAGYRMALADMICSFCSEAESRYDYSETVATAIQRQWREILRLLHDKKRHPRAIAMQVWLSGERVQQELNDMESLFLVSGFVTTDGAMEGQKSYHLTPLGYQVLLSLQGARPAEATTSDRACTSHCRESRGSRTRRSGKGTSAPRSRSRSPR